MFGSIDCLKVRWEALVSVSSLTAICLFHNLMVAAAVVVTVVVFVVNNFGVQLALNAHSNVTYNVPSTDNTQAGLQLLDKRSSWSTNCRMNNPTRSIGRATFNPP